MAEETDNPYTTFSGEKRPFRGLKLWKVLTLLSSLIAITIAAVFVWYVLTHKTEKASEKQNAGTDFTLACPQLPTLFPLPKETPKQITEVFEKLNSALSAAIDESSSLPAISMNVFYRDEILWSGHYGSKVYKQPTSKPNDTTVYRIGSVTKIFAVLLVYKLYEEGKISSIDDPLSKYAPNFSINNPFTGDNITLREIASQMSGLPREAPCLYQCTNTSSREQLTLLRNRTLVLPPWTEPSYSNLGYALLGRLLTENLLNDTFENWTKDNILKPLGMANTGFQITEEVEKNMALPYLPNGQRMKFMEIGWLAPAGNMYSTIEDLAKLGMMLAQPDKQKLFKPATLREMMTPKDITPDGVTVWGSPFEMFFREHFLIRTKAGNIDTYSALLIVIPEMALGANILISTTYYIQPTGSQGSALLYKLLVPRLNETLFELQRKSHFPIAPEPFIGKFRVKQVNPIFGTTVTYNITITSYQNFLLSSVLPLTTKSTLEIRYVGENLVFQAKLRIPGNSCFGERIGTLADLYYEPLDKEKLSQGFQIPQWGILAKRLKESGEDPVDEKRQEFDLFHDFKSAI
ncbi:putative beta-lactamase-like 1 [Stylophora pistillata]|nr:putative beta-lactamase-like 1 [Stylophora pistillata]